MLARKDAELQKLPAEEVQRRLIQFLIQRGPTVVFLLLPIFALLLQIFYWRSRRFYAEHFVFALHLHTFAFLIMTVNLVLPNGGWLGFVAVALLAWIALYGLLSLKRVYQQGWIFTTAKYFIIGFLYFSLFVFAIAIEFIAAVLLI